jgi:dienelactone hydrolase
MWQELKRRKVVRVAIAYAVVGWLLIEIAATVEDPLSLPEWTDTLVIVLLAIGFVIAVFLAWAYELTPGGLARERPAPDDARAPVRSVWVGYVTTAVLAAAVGATSYWFLSRDTDTDWLETVALPDIEARLAVGDWQGAYAITREAEARMPQAPELEELWPRLSWRTTIESDPAGATVFRQPFDRSDEQWEVLGRTPLEDVRFPYGLSRVRLELEGYRTLHRAVGGAFVNWRELGALSRTGSLRGLVGPETFVLDTEETLPDGKVRISGWNLRLDGEDLELADYFLDRYEVTNARFKAFVDAGGYQRSSLWDPIVLGGDTIDWVEAGDLFTDRTGQPGPSTWQAGDYPEGQDDFPVSGVSWYEARAFARFAGEELPTAHHWRRGLAPATLPWLLPESNFDGAGSRSGRESRAMSYTGAFDMAGNVREWTATRLGDEYVVLGGSWNDPYYVVGEDNTAAPPLDRSPGNGFRLVMTHDEPGVAAQVRAPLTARSNLPHRFTRQPTSNEIYEAYGRLFDYEQGPLNVTSDDPVESRSWIRERITFDAGYGGERTVLYLYVPTVGSPPFHTVVYWPGWDTFRLDSVDEYFAKQADFLLKSGRAVAFPVYLGSFERGDGTPRPPFNSTAYRDNAIAGVKDLRRTLDYLETRHDVDHRTIAFYGYSWGGVNGPTALAREPRLRSAVIYVGMLPDLDETPEVDPVNSLPRVEVPLLLLSGEFDALVPVENARRYFELLGTPEDRKRHVITPAGHFVPRDVLIRETLGWLDTYQGRPGG